MSSSVKVMLVDDSAVIRSVVRHTIETEQGIEVVASVENGQVAIEKAAAVQPNIIILDVEMPVMDGLTALPEILKASPRSKVIMFSTLTAQGADTTLKAMALGAVECLVKPSSQFNTASKDEFQDRLITLIKNLYPGVFRALAVDSKRKDLTDVVPAPSKEFTLNKDPEAYAGRPSLLAIGSSTGGPNALFEVLSHLGNLKAPIVITQHMPPTFTKILAQHITDKTPVNAVEGEDGMVIKPGYAYVAPGGFHMTLERKGVDVVLRVKDGAPINFCKPAVDPMFNSAVNVYGDRVLGAILTGMGSDGLGGGQNIAQAKGRLIAQDKETSTVWGMPKAVAEANICCEVLPLSSIGPWIKKQFI